MHCATSYRSRLIQYIDCYYKVEEEVLEFVTPTSSSSTSISPTERSSSKASLKSYASYATTTMIESEDGLEEFLELQKILAHANSLLNISHGPSSSKASSCTRYSPPTTSILTNPHFLSLYQLWHEKLSFMTNILHIQLIHPNFDAWNPANVFTIQHEVFLRINQIILEQVVLFPKDSSVEEMEEIEAKITWKSAIADTESVANYCYQSIYFHCATIYQALIVHSHIHRVITQLRQTIHLEFPHLGHEWDFAYQIFSPNEFFEPFDSFIQKYDLLQLLQE